MDPDNDPEFLTLGAAARACNRSKATISRAVRSGRLPAKAATDNSGGWLIRREDLDRVFPPLPKVTAETVVEPLRVPRDEDENRREVERLRVEVEGLRERLTGLQQRVAGLEADKVDLRSERDRLLAIVETQSQQPKRRKWWPWG
jgi:helix-turn-helix protein